MSRLKESKKSLIAAVIMLAVILMCIGYYIYPVKMETETGSFTSEEQHAVVEEVTDYLVKYVVSDGFVEQIGESENLKERFAEMIKNNEVVLLNEEQIDSIAQYAADNYNTLLGSNIDTLTDEQIKELEKSIRDNIIVTIGKEAERKTEDVNTITGGVSSIVINNILAQLDQMNESIEQLQADLNTIKENIAMGSSFADISDSIGKLEERLEFVKENLTEEDKALADNITEIEEDLRTLHVNVDETATVVVQLESTMDSLTRENLDALSVQIGNAEGSINKILQDFQTILEKLNNLQSSMTSKDTELNTIIKEAADKVTDLSGLIAALQKELNNYKAVTDKTIKTLQDTQLALDRSLAAYKNTTDKSLTSLKTSQDATDKNLSSYKSTTDKSLTNLFTGQEKTDKNLSSYKESTNKSLTDLFTGQEKTDKDLNAYKNTTDQSLTDLENEQLTIGKNLQDYKDITDADILNIYAIIENLEKHQQGSEVDLTEIRNKLVSLDEGLNQCFTSVSSGKAALASALTDKGIETDAVAAFGTLVANINKIGQNANAASSSLLYGHTAYVGNTYITGSMANIGAVTAALNCGQSYTVPQGYHNGTGKITANSLASQTPATATAANLSKGATAWVNGRIITGTGADNNEAYNKGYADGMNDALSGAGISYTYHTHSGSSAGGGCYTVPIYHVHTSGCYVDRQCDCIGYSQGEFGGNHEVDGWPIYSCLNCPHANYRHGSGKCNAVTSELNCGKTESTIEGYDLGCGKTEATIESATIVFK